MLVLAAIDFYQYASTGRTVGAAAAYVDISVFREHFSLILLFLSTLLVFAPLLLGAARVWSGTTVVRLPRLTLRGRTVTVTHIGLSLLLCYVLLTEHEMQLLGGYELVTDSHTDRMRFAFTPLFMSWWYLLCFASAFGANGILKVYTVVRKGTTPRHDDRSRWQRYVTCVKMSDLDGDLYPISGRHRLNFNSAALATEARVVRRKVDRTLNEFQRSMPGSSESREYLQGLAKRARTLVGDLLLAGLRDSETLTIEFLPSTSRALEVALTREGREADIIVSPYEHESEKDVARWAATSRHRLLHISKAVALSQASGSDAEVGKVLSELRGVFNCDTERRMGADASEEAAATAVIESTKRNKRVPRRARSKKNRKAILIVSDVCYATGITVPVHALREAVQSCGVSPVLIVDGAHAVGNLRMVAAGIEWQYYVLSAHKWLLSPEPCGILISKTKSSIVAYDSWGDALPNSTASARMLASVCAGLEMIKRHGFEGMWERAGLLRDELVRRVEGRFVLLGHGPTVKINSLMVALAPASGERWDIPKASGLESYFRKRSASVAVFEDDSGIYVRLSFPYYLDFGDIARMVEILNGALAGARVL